MAKKSNSKSHLKTPAERLRICVTGDIFFEQYIWPQGTASFGEASLPYTWPDELRACEATTTFHELSGAPLHADLFQTILGAWGFNRKQGVVLRAIPTRKQLKSAADRYEDAPFPIYLHELEPFTISESRGNSDKDKVWRIARSFGELRSPIPPRKAADATIARHVDALSAPHQGKPSPVPQVVPDDPADADLKTMAQHVATWMQGALTDNDTPIVVVINDRNALKEKKPKTSIRAHFDSIIATLPQGTVAPADRPNLLILWHTRSPIFTDNPLATFLLRNDFRGATIPIVNYHCLRDAGVPLRFDVSYEASLDKLLHSQDHPAIKSLLQFPHALIRFDYGVMHLSSNGDKLTGLDIHGLSAGPYSLIPSRHGIMLGTTPLLIASLLREISELLIKGSTLKAFFDSTRAPKHPTICHNSILDRAIDVALLLASMHFRRGFGRYVIGESPRYLCGTKSDALYRDLIKEFRKVSTLNSLSGSSDVRSASLLIRSAEVSGVETEELTRISVDISATATTTGNTQDTLSRINLLTNTDVMKSFLDSRDSADRIPATDPFRAVLHGIVRYGLGRVLTKARGEGGTEPSVVCPFVAFGQYMTVDAQDIDSFLAVRNLVDKYLSYKDWTTPLAIAVFGRPGSGKSRIVREVLQTVPMCTFDASLECNMSQWTSVESLSRQFHKIQDRTRHGQTPVVLFDEFDSPLGGQAAGWLKYFLMPLQDGTYMDGTDTFHMGKSVFVFAGGLAHSYEQFWKGFTHKAGPEAKVTDFISRLRGTIDVQDISYKTRVQGEHGETQSEEDLTGLLKQRAQIKRAVLLRALLNTHLKQIFAPGPQGAAHLHPAIIDAFLGVREFFHGVRSMEAVIQMSRVSPRASNFMPSALPIEAQLRIHMNQADAERFLQAAQSGHTSTIAPVVDYNL